VGVDEKNSAGLPEPPDDPSNLRFPALNSRSQEVLETLARQKGRAAPFYEGALRALADRANPVGPEMTAYALRELIQELERPVGGPQEGPKLGDLLGRFRAKWKSAPRRPDDRGLVDHCDPAVFAADQFLDDADAGHLSRRDRAQETLSGLDPVRRPSPPDTQQARVEELMKFRKEFNEALHSPRPTDVFALGSLVEGFETFLLAIFRPRTFDDFSEIDELLKEGPPT
jgi:hypothetical protein